MDELLQESDTQVGWKTKFSDKVLFNILDQADQALVLVDDHNTILFINHIADSILNHNDSFTIGSILPFQIHPGEKLNETVHLSNGEYSQVEISSDYLSWNGFNANLISFVNTADSKLPTKTQHNLYKTIVDYTYDWEYLIMLDGRLSYVSPSCRRITGYSAEDFISSPVLLRDIIHPDDKIRFINHIENNLINTNICSLEFRIIDRSGKERWIGHKCQPVFDPNGEYIGRRISNREITDIKQSELKLKVSAKKFHRFISQSNDGIFLVSPLGDICEWNKSQERITGLKKSDAIGKPFWILRENFNYVKDGEKIAYEFNRESVLEVLKTGQGNWVNNTLDWVVYVKDKSERYIQEHFFTIKAGQTYQLGCITRDITEIKKAAMELEKLNANLEITCENRTQELKNEVIIRQQTEIELKKHLEIEHALSKISRIFIQNVNLQETIPTVLHRLALVTNAYCISLYVNEKLGKKIDVIYELMTMEGTSRLIYPESTAMEDLFPFCFAELREGKNININDYSIICDISHLDGHLVTNQKPGSIILIPVISNREFLGIIRFDYQEIDNKRGDNDNRLFDILAQIIGGALERGKIMDALENQVKDRTREVQILYEIASLASKPNAVVDILKSSLDILMESPINIGAGFIHFQENQDEDFLLIHQKRIPEEATKGITSLNESGYIRDQFIKSMRPIIIPDLRNQTILPLDICMDRYYSYIGIPIWLKGRIIGVLSLIGENFDQLTMDNIILLSAVGDQIGGAVEGEFLRIRAKEAAVIEERQRLARELHDSVTQYLYSLTLLTRGWQNEVDTSDSNEIKHWLEHAGEISNIALKEMRLLLYTLHPQTMLDRDGLLGTINRYLDNLKTKGNVLTEFNSDPNINLPPNIEYELFRIVQESLTNIVKHSKATKIIVNIKNRRDYIELQVKDNGVGFDPQVIRNGKGLGISLMRERARDIKSLFSIDSKPGNGTIVTVKVNTKQF